MSFLFELLFDGVYIRGKGCSFKGKGVHSRGRSLKFRLFLGRPLKVDAHSSSLLSPHEFTLSFRILEKFALICISEVSSNGSYLLVRSQSDTFPLIEFSSSYSCEPFQHFESLFDSPWELVLGIFWRLYPQLLLRKVVNFYCQLLLFDIIRELPF